MLYVENKKVLEFGYVGSCGSDYEAYAKRNGLYYSMDDMGNHYLSFDKDCECFEPVEE